ncbi:MAG: NAD-dependent epimerase/dehydratase family protein [Magnetovibrionaceae bacterium]
MTKALVIGSKGNVGAPLSRHLRAQGYEVLEVDWRPDWREGYMLADINQPLDLLPAFDWKPDVVFALAAMVSRVTCEQASGLAVDTNLSGLNNILQLCKRVDARCVVFSTSEVYGPECNPMDESLSDPQPNNRYGLTKLISEELVKYEVRTHGLKASILRPFMFYDEEEDFGDHRSALIRFAWRLAQGLPIEVHQGSARGWCHISDALKAIEAASQVTDGTIINVGNPEIIDTADLAELVRGHLDADPALINVKPLPARMTLVKVPTLERQRDILGVVPQVSIKEGVNRVCDRTLARLADQ